jgi:hypothetical protein
MYASMLYQLRREARAEQLAEAGVRLAPENRLALGGNSEFYTKLGADGGGIQRSRVAQVRRSLADIIATGKVNWLAEFQGLLAERLGAMEAAGAGFELVDEALNSVKSGWRWYEADLHRIKADLLPIQDEQNKAKAEECFYAAISVARDQSAIHSNSERR